MRDPLSKKITGIAPSGIRKFFDIVSEMPDAISLGVGEPDFDTPWREYGRKESILWKKDVHFIRQMQDLRNCVRKSATTWTERSMCVMTMCMRLW